MKNQYLKILLLITFVNLFTLDLLSEWHKEKISSSFITWFESDSGRIFAYGPGGIIFSKSNAENSWQKNYYPRMSDNDFIFNYIKENDRTLINIYDKQNKESRIYLSHNAGGSWDTLLTVKERVMNAYFYDSTSVLLSQYVASSENSYIIKASIEGPTFDTLLTTQSGSNTALLAFMVSPNDTTIVAGFYGGTLGFSRNKGKTWAFTPISGSTLFRLRVAKRNVFAFYEDPYKFYILQTSASAWGQTAFDLQKYHPIDVCFDSTNNAIYLLANAPNNSNGTGVLLKSSDNGFSWKEVYSVSDDSFYSMHLHNNTIFIGTASGNVLWNNDITSVEQDPIILSNVQLFPSPSFDFINLKSSNETVIYTYQITNLSGSNVVSGSINNSIDNKIDVSKLNAGIYFILINTSKGIETMKFIKN